MTYFEKVEFAKNRLLGELSNKIESEQKLNEIIEEYGPIVDSYPIWHPFVFNQDSKDTYQYPNKETGYKNFLHNNVYFLNAFISCPERDYFNELQMAIKELNKKLWGVATINIDRLDCDFYSLNCYPVLITCDWEMGYFKNDKIPASIAIGLLLEKELPCWKDSQKTNTWEELKQCFLGTIMDNGESAFVNSETEAEMKKIWDIFYKIKLFG